MCGLDVRLLDCIWLSLFALGCLFGFVSFGLGGGFEFVLNCYSFDSRGCFAMLLNFGVLGLLALMFGCFDVLWVLMTVCGRRLLVALCLWV